MKGGPHERIISGNTAAVQTDLPFNALSTFGGTFLSNFECSQMAHLLLEQISFVDTPGVQLGEKENTHRSYDFTGVVKWFAEKSHLIILLFDPHISGVVNLEAAGLFFRRVLDNLAVLRSPLLGAGVLGRWAFLFLNQFGCVSRSNILLWAGLAGQRWIEGKIDFDFKHVILSLRGQEDKIRVVLNKADQIDHQQIFQ
ncbi:LOW QUALITY PROTEIN: hypothetical protein OSB04_un000983 [Centaurea solstitialis]|uniref:Uncharacterized protein n=1 Tax=Centaurea solstitialis TaxID=347529 RepID=A0AA38S415_9ASTR|nr:LOW QUALITY PROTEIN: hypothetical protein OSB04_un000983 [Centaurea solstitialis]